MALSFESAKQPFTKSSIPIAKRERREALIRWHVEQRMVLPRAFIAIAEEAGLVTEIRRMGPRLRAAGRLSGVAVILFIFARFES